MSKCQKKRSNVKEAGPKREPAADKPKVRQVLAEPVDPEEFMEVLVAENMDAIKAAAVSLMSETLEQDMNEMVGGVVKSIVGADPEININITVNFSNKEKKE